MKKIIILLALFCTATFAKAVDVPTGITAMANSTSSITVSWLAVPGATGYIIYRGTSVNGAYTQTGTSTTSYTNADLTAGTTYYYKVAAYNSGGTGSQSSYVTAITLPGTTGIITATTNSATSITVSWSAVTGSAGYYIYRSPSADGAYTQVDSSTTTSYTNTDLTAGTTYYYKVAAYNSAGEGSQSGYVSAVITPLVTDTRDNQVYGYVTIGTQTWMAKNLNYNASGSECYSNDSNNCNIYGRLYSWEAAMDIPTTFNSSSYTASAKHQGVCPTGWHIPSDDEWTTLTDYVGGASAAGTKLKSENGWNDSDNGTNYYGFFALPGGFGSSDGRFYSIGNYGYWWSATEYHNRYAYYRYMGYYINADNRFMGYIGSGLHRHNFSEYVGWYGRSKTDLFSVRCLKD